VPKVQQKGSDLEVHGMPVMFNVYQPVRVHTMTKGEGKRKLST
jgi:hypothetical protein